MLCRICLRDLPVGAFYEGVASRCKECHKEAVRRNYRKNIERYKDYERKRASDPKRRESAKKYQRAMTFRSPGKRSARVAVGNALRDGRLNRQPCAVCGASASEAHHFDYSRPLDVTWLCFKHHREEHGQVVEAAATTKVRLVEVK